MTETPEFSRPRRLDTLGDGETRLSVEADPGERSALARRFGLKTLEALKADYTLRRDAVGVLATGTLHARVIQACIVTDADVPAAIDEAFALRFLPEPVAGGSDEIELDEAEMDTIFFDGAAIDLGEAAAETLALALDPYPRAAGAGDALRAIGVQRDDEVKPAGALAGLKDLLDKG